MVTREELEKFISLIRQRESHIDGLYKLGIDVGDSKLADCTYKLEDLFVNHFWDECDQDAFWEYIFHIEDKVFSKDNPFMWDKDDTPLIWDDDSFIDYMLKSQKK